MMSASEVIAERERVVIGPVPTISIHTSEAGCQIDRRMRGDLEMRPDFPPWGGRGEASGIGPVVSDDPIFGEKIVGGAIAI